MRLVGDRCIQMCNGCVTSEHRTSLKDARIPQSEPFSAYRTPLIATAPAIASSTSPRALLHRPDQGN